MGTTLGTTGTSTPNDNDMAYPPGMELHGSKWRIKKRVPQDLRRKHPDLYPSQFLTLKTNESDRRAAARKAWVWLGELEEEFQRVRDTGSKYKRVLPPGAVDEIIHAAIHSSLQADEQLRSDGLDDFTYERWIEGSIKERQAREKLVIARGVVNAETEDMAHEWLVGFGYDLDRSSPEFKQFAVEFFRRTQMATKAMQARSEGEWVQTPSPLPPTKPASEVPKLSRVIEYFLSKQDPTVPMFKKYRPALDLLLEVLGDRTVDQIKQVDIEEFFDLICKLPSNWAHMKRKHGLSIRELAAMSWPVCIARKTFKDGHLPAIRKFLASSKKSFRDQGFPEALTLEGIKYAGSRNDTDQAQRAFNQKELERLFMGQEYLGFARSPSKHHFYWLPLIGLYTGARVNEVCQLNPQSDISEHDGVWAFNISEETEADERVTKSVKNKPSRRLVPIHSELIRLGLLDYVEQRKQAGDKLLFPKWSPSSAGRAADKAEVWFRRLIERLGLKDDTPGARIAGFHAFRSTLLNRAFNLDVPDAYVLTGHAATDVSRVVQKYRGPKGIKEKQKLMEMIRFDIQPPPIESPSGGR